jgi:diguanylate cyclase (GGDEF)-like protein
VSRLHFNCRSVPSADRYRNGWVWLRLPADAPLGGLPKNWHLMTDQGRFDQVAMVARMRDGSSQSVTREAGNLRGYWAPGGMMRFVIERPGRDVRDIQVGFLRLDDLSLMRKLSVASNGESLKLYAKWLLLIGVFAGALLSAFAYNLLIYTGQRYAFQRLYLVWTLTVLAYGLCWTNAATVILPWLSGPLAVRIDYMLLGFLIGAGNAFFMAVIEEGILPRWLTRGAWVLSIATVLSGFLAAADWLLPPMATDHLMNVVVIACTSTVAIGIGIAVKRRSRVVWFYLLGWMPVICVFVLRVARNMGIAPQNDMVDMATFVALAFESIALSLAIADRFRLLRQERDEAARAHDQAMTEGEVLRRAALTDPLTGLGNRTAFQAGVRTLGEAGTAFSLFLIDVDHLKQVNDRLGHDGGDALLAHIGRRLQSMTGPDGLVVRLGGDEFAVMAPHLDGAAQALAAALDTMQDEPWFHGGRSWTVSLSVGAARFPDDATTIDALYKNADLALYQAKKLGRGRRHDYDPVLRARLDQRERLVEEAHAGLAEGAFTLHYQPLMDMAQGRVLGHEALLRWNHPEHGLITPSLFGDILNDRKLAALIQDRVLGMALADLRRHGDRLVQVAINCTAAQLDGPYAARRLLGWMEAAGVSPRQLCVEVTEDILLGRSVGTVAEALETLRGAGVGIALDDFGTGYASLIHLRQLPFDTMKIDRSFVLGLLDEDRECEEIVRAIIGLGHGLGKRVVAEGIETEAQHRRLVELGCQLGQGYLFSRPVALDVLIAGSHRDGRASAAA